MNIKNRKQQVEYFSKRFTEHGDSHQALDWNSKTRQYKSFEAVTGSLELNGKKILDVGCGLGHLFEYLKEQGNVVDYTGVDVVEEMTEYAGKKHSDAKFLAADFLAEDFEEMFDMVFISGVFNVKMRNHWNFVEEMLKKSWSLCNEALAFNMISNYVDYKEPHLYYANPLAVFHSCKKLTKRVSLLHDYLPFEFSIVMNKRPFSSDCYSKNKHANVTPKT